MGNRGMRRQRENSKRKEEPQLLLFIFRDNTSKNQHLWKIKARTKNWYSTCNSYAKNRFRKETMSTYDKIILYKFPEIVTSCELFRHRTYRSCILCAAHTEPSARVAMWICETPRAFHIHKPRYRNHTDPSTQLLICDILIITLDLWIESQL